MPVVVISAESSANGFAWLRARFDTAKALIVPEVRTCQCLARLYMNASVPHSAMCAVSVSVPELTQTAGRNANA